MPWAMWCAEGKNHSNRVAFQCAAFVAILACVLLFQACAGVSVPGNANTSSGSGTPPPPPPTPSLTITSTLPSGTVGAVYSGSLGASGGTAPYTFSLASGQLPAGLLLAAASGAISGTPAASGTFSFVIAASDAKALSKQQSLQITIASAPVTNNSKSFSNLQQSTWGQYGLTPPTYATCSPSPCGGISYSMTQGIASPSMSGDSTQFDLGGTTLYGDVLFNNHLIGDFSSQGLPDTNHTLVPTYHSFTYDVDFYTTSLPISQALEFDINQFFNNLGFTWGHECRIAGGNEWDIWDNVTQHWVPTGISCYPKNNSWNHLTIQVQRTSDNHLLYQSITLNGVTNTLNQYSNPGSTPGWYGITINYQMDGNYQQTPYSVYLDNLTFTYE